MTTDQNRFASSRLTLCYAAFVVTTCGATVQAQTTRPAHVPAGTVLLPKTITLNDFGIRFGYPGDFMVGSLETVPRDPNRFFENAFVLVESSVANGLELSEIPVGGSVPKITIHLLPRQFTESLFSPVIAPEWRTEISGHEVVKFPGYPAPLGENAHCYLVPRSDGSAILFLANRFYNERPKGKENLTHYDWVIERMIASMTFTRGAQNHHSTTRPSQR